MLLIYEMLEVLKALAMMNATRKVVKISSKELAEHIGQSLQTAARKLKELEDERLIDRNSHQRRQFVVITEKGKQLLYKEYMDYKKIFRR